MDGGIIQLLKQTARARAVRWIAPMVISIVSMLGEEATIAEQLSEYTTIQFNRGSNHDSMNTTK